MRLYKTYVVALVGCGSVFSAAAEAGVARMYFTDFNNNQVRRTYLGSVQNVVDVNPGGPYEIVIDPVGGKVYWVAVNPKRIERANLDGTCVEIVVTIDEVGGGVNEIAIDVIGGKVYWSKDDGNIKRINIDGTGEEDFIIGASPTIAVAVDSEGGKVYWSDNGNPSGSPRIMRANIEIPAGETPDNRSDIETLVIGQTAISMALDTTDGKMYWYWFNQVATLSRANLDGSNIEVLGTSATGIIDIALDPLAGKIYWTNGSVIRRANMEPPLAPSVETILDNFPNAVSLALHLEPITMTAGDMNGDGLVNGIDVQLFVDKLLSCP